MNRKNIHLYDLFHKNTKLQKKIIGENNFTYHDILGLINTNLPYSKNSQVLDYGCGVGTISLYIANKGYHVTGVDISKKAITRAKTNAKQIDQTNARFVSLEKYTFKKNFFDAIICIEVLEHVPKPNLLLRDFASALKKNGVLILTTPSINAPLYKLGLLREFDQEVGHLRRYSRDELSKSVTSSGFKIVSITEKEGLVRNILYTNRFLNWIIKFIRGPLVGFILWIDRISTKLCGESDYFLVAYKP